MLKWKIYKIEGQFGKLGPSPLDWGPWLTINIYPDTPFCRFFFVRPMTNGSVWCVVHSSQRPAAAPTATPRTRRSPHVDTLEIHRRHERRTHTHAASTPSMPP